MRGLIAGSGMTLLLVPVAVALLSVSVEAQSGAPVPPDARVRVWSPELGRRPLTGQLRELSDDSLLLRGLKKDGVPVSVSRASITRLDVYTRMTRGEGARTGAVIGAVGALSASIALGALTGSLGEATYYPNGTDRPGMPVWLGFVMEASIGAVVGAAAGAIYPMRYWRRVPPAQYIGVRSAVHRP